MSGVYIKGMEMPKERESFTVTIKYNGLVFDTESGIQVAEAQEIPLHGRCIDADALIAENWFLMKIVNGVNCAWTKSKKLKDVPTVIPAYEPKEGT